jgi:abscisic acid receptor (PYR/PYL family)
VRGDVCAAAEMVQMDGAVGVGAGGQAAPAPAPRLWRLVDERCDLRAMETDYVRRFHRHEPRDHQCSSAVAKHIKAPVHLVSASELNLSAFLLSPCR